MVTRQRRRVRRDPSGRRHMVRIYRSEIGPVKVYGWGRGPVVSVLLAGWRSRQATPEQLSLLDHALIERAGHAAYVLLAVRDTDHDTAQRARRLLLDNRAQTVKVTRG